MVRYAVFAVAITGAVAAWDPVEARAQEPESAADMANLFLDCQRAPGCNDDDFLRREIPYVNWVRDREAADVHVLVTSQGTGGGGRLYTFDFIGVGAYEGVDQQLTEATPGDATSDEARIVIAERLRVGLVPYVIATPAAARLRVSYGDEQGPGGGGPGARGPGGAPPGALGPQDDPWDFWTFRISGNGFVRGESTSSFQNTSASFNAERTTDAWKVSLYSSYSRFKQEFEIPLGGGEFRTVEEIRKDWGVGGTVVGSVGRQWAMGVRVDAGSSTFVNQDFRLAVKPGVEYNLVPYSESSRRAFTIQYLVGPTHFDYEFETIFGETSETRLQQSLTGNISLFQPWGRWSTSITGAQYLHDTSKYNVSISGNLSVRLFRGFSVRVGGNYSWIRDQLHLSSAGYTDEQILLRQRQLATSYRYFTNFGIEYRFGSIFNNVVNPRFGGSGGGGGEVFFF